MSSLWIASTALHTTERSTRNARGCRRANTCWLRQCDRGQPKTRRPAIVMAASNHVTGLQALIAARRAGLPLIYKVRGLWEITRMARINEFQDKAAFHVQKILEASVASGADHVFTLTEGMRQESVEREIHQKKIDLLPNSCDPVAISPNQQKTEYHSDLRHSRGGAGHRVCRYVRRL